MILTNVKIYAHDQIIQNGYIEIDNGVIVDYGTGYKQGIDMSNHIVIPGFIDQHFHGVYGYDIMRCTPDELSLISKHITKYGVTSYLPTTLTEDKDVIKDVLSKISNYKKNQSKEEAQMLGIHLEGPFLNTEFCGAQDKNHIIDPNIMLFNEFYEASNKTIKMVTYALEKGETGFTKHLDQLNIVPSIGHSAATFSEVEEAIKEGLKCVTHFHNASSPYHHRNPGIINAGLYFDQLQVELIVDGYHVQQDVVKLVKKVKTAKHINLVTDSSSATGLPDGEYMLGRQKITKEHECVTLDNGTLAGSALKMCDGFTNMKHFTDSSIEELVLMSSTNPAKLLQVDHHKGKIKEGYDADLVIMNNDLEIIETYVLGHKVYKRG